MKTEYSTISISQNLFKQLINLYKEGVKQLGSGKVLKNGINGYCDSAISAYPITLAAWESFLHETFLSQQNLIQNKDSAINSIPLELIDRWDIQSKSVVIPELLYGNTFDKGSMPFQDFAKIVAIRNSIVHFKLSIPNKALIGAIKDLKSRNILLDEFFNENGSDEDVQLVLWPLVISTTESIRWCINTITQMVHKIIEFVPSDRTLANEVLIDNFVGLTENDAIKIFEELEVRI